MSKGINQLNIPAKPSAKRHSGWDKVRAEHIKKQPACMACGKKALLAVHHIIPIHIDRTRELDPTNLITLCENPSSSFCHYIFGHLALSWLKYDKNVVNAVATRLIAVQTAIDTQP